VNSGRRDVDKSACQVSLDPGQTAHIDSAQNESLTLRCGYYAESLAIVDTEQCFASTKSVGDN